MATPAPGNAPTAATAAPRGSIAFIMPPPVTIWFQFDDGSQVGMAPTLQRLATAMMPLFGGGMPVVFMPGLFGGLGGNDDGVTRAIHEHFMRSQNEQHGPPPTSKAFLDKIPLKTWTAQSKDTEKHTDCSICLCDFEVNDEVLPLPCGHQFHKDCGMKWLVEHNVCPTCRHALPTQDVAVTKPEEPTQPRPTPAAHTPISTTAQREPEPEAEPNCTARVRPRSPALGAQRLVRRRISERDALVLPGTTDEAELDRLLEKEASRLVAEEEANQHADDVRFDDVDIEDLLRDASN